MLALRSQRVLALPPFLVRVETVPALLIAVATAALLVWFTGPLCPDVTGQFWLAHSIRGGSRIYVDIVEINPPLWFWMAIPIDWVSEVLGVRVESTTIVVVAAVVAAAMRALFQMLSPYDRVLRAGLVTYAGAVLLIMPAMQFEQREHIALIGAVPYLALAAVRRQARNLHWTLAALVGVGGGLGFALKHYFLGVPVLIEIWLIVSLRGQWRPLRPETLALAATGTGYAVAFLMVTPQYLTNTVPLLLSTYQGLGPSLWQTLGFVQIFWLRVTVGIALQHRLIREGTTPLTVAFLIGAAGFAGAWAIQHKGWLYQGLPTTGCIALAFSALLVEAGPRLGRSLIRIAPALLIAPLALVFIRTEAAITPENDIAPALVDLRRGDVYSLVSSAGASSWPATVGRGLRQSSRYRQYWMLDAMHSDAHSLHATALGNTVVRQTALDYRCLPPKVVIFTRFVRNKPGVSVVDDPYPFFIANPAYSDVMSHYRLWKVGPIYDAYRQVTPLAPVDRRLCLHVN